MKTKKKNYGEKSISMIFAKKYIYYYYAFIWSILILYLFLK